LGERPLSIALEFALATIRSRVRLTTDLAPGPFTLRIAGCGLRIPIADFRSAPLM